VFCHPVSYCNVRRQENRTGRASDVGADGVRSLRDKVSRARKGSSRIVRGGCDCQHQVVRGEDGVVWSTATCGSRRELLINVVMGGKRKMLDRLTRARTLGPKWQGVRYGCS